MRYLRLSSSVGATYTNTFYVAPTELAAFYVGIAIDISLLAELADFYVAIAINISLLAEPADFYVAIAINLSLLPELESRNRTAIL